MSSSHSKRAFRYLISTISKSSRPCEFIYILKEALQYSSCNCIRFNVDRIAIHAHNKTTDSPLVWLFEISSPLCLAPILDIHNSYYFIVKYILLLSSMQQIFPSTSLSRSHAPILISLPTTLPTTPPPPPPTIPATSKKNGCFNASSAVILRAGSY